MHNIKLPKIIGHRGAKGLAPENTLSSLIAAQSSGLSFVEIDVKISNDNVPVLLHDDNLDRTTNGSGLCCDFNFKELSNLDSGKWFDEKYKDEKILSLSEGLDYLYKNRMGVNIELKPNKGKEKENVTSIKKLLELKKNIPNYFFSSFDILSLECVVKNIPLARKSLLVEKNSPYKKKDIIDICEKYNCFSIGLEIDMIDSEIVEFFKKNNLIITVFTVNDEKIAKSIFSLGVDSIFTDRPDFFNF